MLCLNINSASPCIHVQDKMALILSQLLTIPDKHNLGSFLSELNMLALNMIIEHSAPKLTKLGSSIEISLV